MSVCIDFAESIADFDNAKQLFLEYADSPGFSLCFQGFEEELENLPGKYAAPDGCILLARDKLDCVGCVGLRPLNQNVCEMKRLYVKPAFRRIGLGRCLAERIVLQGSQKNYVRMQLDTLSNMKYAMKLYRSLGFVETDPYYNNPHPEVVFFEISLDKPTQA